MYDVQLVREHAGRYSAVVCSSDYGIVRLLGQWHVFTERGGEWRAIAAYSTLREAKASLFGHEADYALDVLSVLGK